MLERSAGMAEAEVEVEHRTANTSCGLPSCSETLSKALQACSKCKIRRDCSKEHQKEDWSVHKKFCRPPLPEDSAQPTELDPTALSLKQRTSLASFLAKSLIDAVNGGGWPSDDDVARVFGFVFVERRSGHKFYVGIDDDVNTLMYNSWRFLHNAYVDFYFEEDWESGRVLEARAMLHSELRGALLGGTLPSYELVQSGSGSGYHNTSIEQGLSYPFRYYD
ncbi:hypothetical protein B484DRAFT_404401 [Ochromonadaceae sp. CCMP2298]|nr:hypothetical protein B484DRAFT_404401 [Ochromonadaceae sp. CCMP2298]